MSNFNSNTIQSIFDLLKENDGDIQRLENDDAVSIANIIDTFIELNNKINSIDLNTQNIINYDISYNSDSNNLLKTTISEWIDLSNVVSLDLNSITINNSNILININIIYFCSVALKERFSVKLYVGDLNKEFINLGSLNATGGLRSNLNYIWNIFDEAPVAFNFKLALDKN